MVFGENEAEYGNPIADSASSLRDKSYYAMEDLSEIRLGGVSIPELIEKYEVELSDLTPVPAGQSSRVGKGGR